MDRLAGVIKEVSSQSQSYAQVTISGDLFSRLVDAAQETRQDLIRLENSLHSHKVKVRNLESLLGNWQNGAERTKIDMEDWANRLSSSISETQRQILNEQELAAQWIGHLQREQDKNRFLETSIRMKNEQFSNLKVELAVLTSKYSKLSGEHEILKAAYQKASYNESISFQKKAEADKQLRQQVVTMQAQVNEFVTKERELVSTIDHLRQQESEYRIQMEKLETALREGDQRLMNTGSREEEYQSRIGSMTNELEKNAKLLKSLATILEKGSSSITVAELKGVKQALEIGDIPRVKLGYKALCSEHTKLQQQVQTLENKIKSLAKQLETSKSKLSEVRAAESIQGQSAGVQGDSKGKEGTGEGLSPRQGSRSVKSRKMDEEVEVPPAKPQKGKSGKGGKTEWREEESLLEDSAGEEGQSRAASTRSKVSKKSSRVTKKKGNQSKATKGSKVEEERETVRSPGGRRTMSEEGKPRPLDVEHPKPQLGEYKQTHNDTANKDLRFSSDFKRLLCNHPNGPDPQCEICRTINDSRPGLGSLSGLTRGTRHR